MANPIVYCHVDNCYYWKEGNRCNAEKILVEIESHLKQTSHEEEFAPEFEEEVAKDKVDTCCHTFRPRYQ